MAPVDKALLEYLMGAIEPDKAPRFWVAEFVYDYEPGFVLGVYSSEEKARAAAAKHCEDDLSRLVNATYISYVVDAD